MKYISLLHVMRVYSDRIRTYRGVCAVNSELSNNAFPEDVQDQRPFNIEAAVNAETGQVKNTVTVRDIINKSRAFGPTLPEKIPFYPFLELEWLRDEMPLSDAAYDAMVQLACMFVMQIAVFVRVEPTYLTSDSWLEFLESRGMIIEVEELEDTPAILQSCTLEAINLPKHRSWATLLFYGSSFPDLFALCEGQSVSFKELYYHMPVLVSLFMVDYCGNELKYWLKQLRLDMCGKIRVALDNFEQYMTAAGDTYTYGLSMSITQTDIALVRSMLTAILDRIQELNSNMGLIPYSTYQSVRGPETVRADVRLANMGINWVEEMDRADMEKKAREEESEQIDMEEEEEVQ